jgi:putative membrane protein
MVPLFCSLALLHPAAQLGWQSFTVHWSTVAGIVALFLLYEWRVRVHRARAATPEEAAGPTTLQHASFVSGLLLMFLSLNGPLHDISDYYLFSGHMVQHLLLTLWMPPMLIYGTPGYLLRPALRFGWVNAIAKRITTATAAFLIFNVTIAVWHLPPMYNAAMEYHPIHIVEHLMFIVTATLMWWPLMSPLPELPRLSYPGQILYSFLMCIPMSIVAVCIAMASEVLYPAYSAAPRIWGITPLLDQQIGGLIMWVPGGLFFLLVATVVFFKWSASGSDSEAGAQISWKPVAQ